MEGHGRNLLAMYSRGALSPALEKLADRRSEVIRGIHLSGDWTAGLQAAELSRPMDRISVTELPKSYFTF